ncbi:MAG TPA: TIGR03435 family protein [Bryobacteraceae bacterium]|nr:TIGR03435 family protein [Bryobacteraceae bacterium]
MTLRWAKFSLSQRFHERPGGTHCIEFQPPLLDKTGLGGTYDVTPEYRRPGLLSPVGDSRMPVNAETEPSIFTALQQLGLKVVRAKGQAEITGIDHAESRRSIDMERASEVCRVQVLAFRVLRAGISCARLREVISRAAARRLIALGGTR